MGLFKKKPPKTRPLTREQSLVCRPFHNDVLSWHETAEGLIKIQYQLPCSPMLLAIFSKFTAAESPRPIKTLELDDMGSTVWKMIDGKKTAAEIIQDFAQHNNITSQESEQAITLFFRQLGKRGLIGLF